VHCAPAGIPCGHLKYLRQIGADGLNQAMVMYNTIKITGNDINVNLSEIRRCEGMD
jgi:hypothetical protein